MKLQFTTKSMLLATAFVAICLGGVLPLSRTFTMTDWCLIGIGIVATGPLWVPCLVVAYSIGRRTLTWRITLAFAVAELLAVGIFMSRIRGWLMNIE